MMRTAVSRSKSNLKRAASKPNRAAANADVTTPSRDEIDEKSIPIDPGSVFQPEAAKIEEYSTFDHNDKKSFGRVSGSKLYYKSVPYAKYLGDWHFHPSRIGGELQKLRETSKRIPALVSGVQDHFVKLPNGGLALYYPKTFRVTRLQCTEYIYSGYAQAQLLAGFSKLVRAKRLVSEEKGEWKRTARKLVTSLEFPFEEGGVCVDGKVILEAPNFRSPPEFILNGWLEALLRLGDYAARSKKEPAQEFFETSTAALADLLPHFDDENLRLSKYSNVSPYVVRLHFAERRSDEGPPKVRLDYTSNAAGFSSFHIADLWTADGLGDCIYENKIMKWSSGSMDVCVTSGSLFDLTITVNADVERLETDTGGYLPRSASPQKSGNTLSLRPIRRSPGGPTVFSIRASSNVLMKGHPTNFAKRVRNPVKGSPDGKLSPKSGTFNANFYHCHHVVALLELSRMTTSPAARRMLGEFALKWLDYMVRPAPAISQSGAYFTDPDGMMRSRGIGRTQFDELVETVRSGRDTRADASCG